MKDLGEANYILGIKLLRDRKNKVLALSQALYIDKILARFSIENSKKGTLPFRDGVHLSKEQSPKLLSRKKVLVGYLLLRHWVVSCMPCYVLG